MATANNNKVLIEQLKSHFGLSGDPFASLTNVFYEGAQRKHCLETLRHLATFGDMVLLLTGDPGSGKSTLIREFQRAQIDALRVFVVDAEKDLSVGSSTIHAVSKFADVVQLTKVTDEPLQQILTRLVQSLDKHFESEGERTLLLIDNADKLPKKELQVYMSFFRGLPAETGAVILFSGLNSLLQFAKQGTNIGQDEWAHQIQVKALLQEEQIEYLQLRMDKVGFTEKLKLSDSQLKHLVEVSKGLPGRINKIFSSVVLEPGLLKIERSNSHKIPKKIIVGVFSLLFLSFVFVSYQHDLFGLSEKNVTLANSEEAKAESDQNKTVSPEESRFLQGERLKRLKMLERALDESGTSVAENKQEQVSSKGSDSLNEKVSLNDEVSLSEKAASKDQITKAKGTTPQVVALTVNSAQINEPGISKPIKDIQHSAKQDEIIGKVPNNAENFSSASQSIKSDVSVKKELVSKAAQPAGFKSQAWAQAQSKNAYSAQILGSYSEDTALKYMKKLGTMDQEIFYLRTRHKGQPWYVVFYGVYPDKLAAKNAITKSPKPIKAQQPWLRRFDGILKSYPSS